MNNHRNRLAALTNLYLYHHTDGHSENDISIMPIEEINTNDRVNSTSERLEREDYWRRELCTFYPYELNERLVIIINIKNARKN